MLEVIQSSNLDAILTQRSEAPMEWQKPTQYDLSYTEDRMAVEEGLQSGAIKTVVDRIDHIANDLYDLQNPSEKDDHAKRAAFIGDVTSQGAAFGRWFHFPWDGTLVRFPDQDVHQALQTSRNRDLVTAEEQRLLSEKTIGIFGLSVGSNVAEKLAMSGIGGTLLMGDPDRIEPSNLNRINGGYTDIGVRKVDRMGRVISELNPYLSQVHFKEGFGTDMLDELASHSPDLLFDEMDSLQAKLAIREFAKERGIPLIMATDVGHVSLIDVERHDIEDVKPFDGRLEDAELDALRTGNVTPQQMGGLMVKIVGMKHISPRVLASLQQVGKTLPGLPQLGTTAGIGGAAGADIARSILLNRNVPSGRYTPDMVTQLSRL
jgi:hypothetical protein